MSTCPNCGGELYGDGFTSVLICENAEEGAEDYLEPDAEIVLCNDGEENNET